MAIRYPLHLGFGDTLTLTDPYGQKHERTVNASCTLRTEVEALKFVGAQTFPLETKPGQKVWLLGGAWFIISSHCVFVHYQDLQEWFNRADGIREIGMFAPR